MTVDHNHLGSRLLFAAGVVLFVINAAQGQAVNSGRTDLLETGSARAKSTGSNRDMNPSGESTDQVDRLKSRVEQLEALIDRQQALLAEMEKRLKAVETGRPSAIPIPARQTLADASKTDDLDSSVIKESGPAGSPVSAESISLPRQKAKLIAGWDSNRPVLRSADGDFEAFIGGVGQFDLRGYQDGDTPANTFLIRRARLTVEGKVARYFEYKIMGDFADTAGTLLRDFFLNIHRTDALQLRFGQFKEPFSQEELTSSSHMDFVERSLVNNLAPARSPGLMVHGSLAEGAVEYQLGGFNARGLLASSANGTPESVLRLRFSPWKNGDSSVKGLSFGGAVAQGRSRNGSSVRGVTESRSFTFFQPESINGKVVRSNGEFTWMIGPASIKAEYDQTNQARDNLGPGGTNLPGVVAKGYMAQFTYLLTGETKPDNKALTPKASLFGYEGSAPGFGAWELKFRYSNLQISDGTPNSNRADSIYFGTNWYLNRFVKHMLDFGLERYKDQLRSPRPDIDNFFVVQSRIQLVF